MRKNILRYTGFVIAITILSCVAITNVAQNNNIIVQSAEAFLQSLPAEQLSKAQFDFEDTLRYSWSNLPVGFVSRPGVRNGDLSEKSRIALNDLLTSYLSSSGYLKVTGIMQLDDILNLLSRQSYDKGQMSKERLDDILNHLKWGYEQYFIAIWGKPGLEQPWGFSFGGHHLAISMTMRGKSISFTPFFIGAEPAQVKSSMYAGWRIFSKEEDYGFMLLNFLSKEQKAKAVLSQSVPKDIITNPKSDGRINSYYGIPAKEFNADQLEVLKILLQEYLHNFEHHVAHDLYAKVEKSGFEKIYFAWIGSAERNKPYYYIINGPDFLIEFDNVGFQDDGNHIHAILREKNNDFGGDLLKQHYLTSDHHKKK